MIINNVAFNETFRDFKTILAHSCNSVRRNLSKKSDDDILVYALCLAISMQRNLERYWQENGKQD